MLEALWVTYVLGTIIYAMACNLSTPTYEIFLWPYYVVKDILSYG